MSFDIRGSHRTAVLAFFTALWMAACLAGTPARAQITQVDPDAAIDGDLAGASVPTELPGSAADAQPGPWIDMSPEPITGDGLPAETSQSTADSWDPADTGVESQAAPPAPTADASATFRKDDLIGAAQGVFGEGSQGLASIIEDILRKQGEPNAYIVGREGGGAVAVGLRYGSGTLYHKVEGNRPVYWTGPSLGFDVGLNAGKAFVLVYNLYDTQELFRRYGAGEGQAYLVGGFNVSYLRRKDVVLIPVRMGAGLRLGANIGWMKFSQKQRWLPF
jgi:hypothetical protein